MGRLESSREFLQRVFDNQVGAEDIDAFISEHGVMGLHILLYDGGLVLGSRGKQLIEDTPALQNVLSRIIEVRMQAGEYREETLKRMYNMD
jgi:hypothetical protein